MDLEIQGQQCKTYSTPHSYKKRSVHISLFIGEKQKLNQMTLQRPKTSVMTYVQRRVLTPVSHENFHPKESLSNPFYMPKMSKSPSPKRNARFYKSKNKGSAVGVVDALVPAQIALKNTDLAKSSVTRTLNLSINIGKIQCSPSSSGKKKNSKFKITDFEERLTTFINTLKK